VSEIIYNIKDHIADIKFNRPEKGNALSNKLISKLTKMLEDADHDLDVKAIIISGKGKHFCSGGDLNDFLALQDKTVEQNYEEIESSVKLFSFGFKIRTPIITSIQGAARGGGLGIVALSHLSIAEKDATFALPEIKRGLFPFTIFPLLARAIGAKKALELSLMSTVFSADKAKEWGLINEVVDKNPYKRAVEVAEYLVSKSELAIRTGLETYNRITDYGIGIFEHAGLLRALTFQSENLKKGIEKFLKSKK